VLLFIEALARGDDDDGVMTDSIGKRAALSSRLTANDCRDY
jgi:hypothetical protein